MVLASADDGRVRHDDTDVVIVNHDPRFGGNLENDLNFTVSHLSTQLYTSKPNALARISVIPGEIYYKYVYYFIKNETVAL